VARADVIVDLQKDASPGGAPVVRDGDAIVDRANKLAGSDDCDRVIGTRTRIRPIRVRRRAGWPMAGALCTGHSGSGAARRH
jgi:hypothetical protein